MISKHKILFAFLAVTIFTGLLAFFIVGQNERPRQPIAPEDRAVILGPGFPKAFEVAAKMCGTDIQLLDYRSGGYYTGDAYAKDTRLSKDKIVEYSFTQGECAPGHYVAIEVVFDIAQNAVTDGPNEHPLGGDSREPISEADLQKIKISVDEAINISGKQPNHLIKLDDTIIWDMSSQNNGLVHQVWINAITGEKMRDETFRPSF